MIVDARNLRPFQSLLNCELVSRRYADQHMNIGYNTGERKNNNTTIVKNAMESWKKKEQFTFSILSANKMIGNVSLNNPDFNKHTVQCDYAISASCWGRGIASEAIRLAVSYAFQNLNMQIVTSVCLERNPASARVLEKNGFVETGRFVYNSEKFQEELTHRFELTKDVWTSLSESREQISF